jgi:hypothetical protein
MKTLLTKTFRASALTLEDAKEVINSQKDSFLNELETLTVDRLGDLTVTPWEGKYNLEQIIYFKNSTS